MFIVTQHVEILIEWAGLRHNLPARNRDVSLTGLLTSRMFKA